MFSICICGRKQSETQQEFTIASYDKATTLQIISLSSVGFIKICFQFPCVLLFFKGIVLPRKPVYLIVIFYIGILPKEKPSEIKTVRIVKRQSERRSRGRDKKKVSYDEESSVWIMDEPDLSSDDYLEMEESKFTFFFFNFYSIRTC